jgi:hypothetical protein
MIHVQTGNMLDVIVEGKSLGLKQRDSDHRKHEVIWLPELDGLLSVLATEIKHLHPAEDAQPVLHEFEPNANGDGCIAYVGSDMCLQDRQAPVHQVGAKTDAPERVWIGRASLEIAQRNGSSDFYIEKVDGLIDVEYLRADLASRPATQKERERCAKIAETVNDSIKDEGKFAIAILNPNTCIVPLSGGGNALQPEHVFDSLGLCVYCGESNNLASRPAEVHDRELLRQQQRHLDAIEQTIRSLAKPMPPEVTATGLMVMAEQGLTYTAALRHSLTRPAEDVERVAKEAAMELDRQGMLRSDYQLWADKINQARSIIRSVLAAKEDK